MKRDMDLVRKHLLDYESSEDMILFPGTPLEKPSRDDERWAKAKETAGKVGVFTIEILKQILTQLIQTKLKQVLP